MTNEEWEELGRRAVACKHWRWMPGMLDTLGNRLYSEDNDEFPKALRGNSVLEPYIDCLIDEDPTSGIPDLRDPATLGCLLHLVREGYPNSYVSVAYFGSIWGVAVDIFRYNAKTMAKALVAALEAAP